MRFISEAYSLSKLYLTQMIVRLNREDYPLVRKKNKKIRNLRRKVIEKWYGQNKKKGVTKKKKKKKQRACENTNKAVLKNIL